MKKKRNLKIKELIFITGLGGSGSRVLGMICQKLGFNLGLHLNKSLDNAIFFKKSNYYGSIQPHKEEHYSRFKNKFLTQLNSSYDTETAVIKEPNFHVFIPFLSRISQEIGFKIKFIHIIRDALYMINSKNQNQFIRWGYLFPISAKKERFKRLEFWYYANQSAIKSLRETNLDHLIVSYDSLTSGDNTELLSILNFLDKDSMITSFDDFVKSISTHRSRSESLDMKKIPEKYQSMIQCNFC